MSPEKIDPWLIVYAVGLERGVCPHNRCIKRLGEGIMWLATDRLQTTSGIVDMLDAQCSGNGLVAAELRAEQSVVSMPSVTRHIRVPQLIAA